MFLARYKTYCQARQKKILKMQENHKRRGGIALQQNGKWDFEHLFCALSFFVNKS